MELILGITIPVGPAAVGLILLVGLFAGLVKGIVGFGLPMIIISGASTVISPELALATLILPTLATNGVQALRQGWAAAAASVVTFRRFLVAGFVTLVLSAQFVPLLSQTVLLWVIGLPVVVFAVTQLIGKQLRLPATSKRIELGMGLLTGTMGGLSGIWGAPTVAYLTATDTPKADQMRVQGVIYGLGAVALMLAHIQSGVLRLQTLPLSVMMVVPALIGISLGNRIQDRIDQAMFRKITLWVLLIAGLNLLRRAMF